MRAYSSTCQVTLLHPDFIALVKYVHDLDGSCVLMALSTTMMAQDSSLMEKDLLLVVPTIT
jgi:hypothetical protein